MKKLVLVLSIILGCVSIAAADTIYLRGGTTLRGNVLGFINGRFAIQLTANATFTVNPSINRNQSNYPSNTTPTTRTASAGEVVFLRPRDIDRIEIDGRSLDDARYQIRTVDVSLGSDWIDTGVDLKRGERVRVDASGIINVGRRRIGPAGTNTTDPSAPLPRAPEGELIGVIGNDYDSPIIELGANREFVAERDGRLYLTPNMTPNVTRTGNEGFYGSGVYKVQLRKEVDLSALTRTDNNRNQSDDTYDPFGFPSESSGPAARRSRQPGYNPNSSGGGGRSNRTLEKVVDVPGNQQRGVDTGIELRTGDQVTITATGSVTAGRRAGVVSPAGGRQGAAGILGASSYPVPTAGVGALVGYILQSNGQTSQVFLVGSQATFTTPVDGRLYLMVNDDNYSDNSGSFSARIVYPEYR
jgi:hypothetical protein